MGLMKVHIPNYIVAVDFDNPPCFKEDVDTMREKGVIDIITFVTSGHLVRKELDKLAPKFFTMYIDSENEKSYTVRISKDKHPKLFDKVLLFAEGKTKHITIEEADQIIKCSGWEATATEITFPELAFKEPKRAWKVLCEELNVNIPYDEDRELLEPPCSSWFLSTRNALQEC